MHVMLSMCLEDSELYESDAPFAAALEPRWRVIEGQAAVLPIACCVEALLWSRDHLSRGRAMAKTGRLLRQVLTRNLESPSSVCIPYIQSGNLPPRWRHTSYSSARASAIAVAWARGKGTKTLIDAFMHIR